MNTGNFDKNRNLATPPRILDYQIVETVYSGSRTLVCLAIRTYDRLPVVIKLLKSEYPTFSELVQFRNQFIIAKKFNSPNIIKTYSLEPYQNSYALVMEDFGGISLQKWTLQQKNALSLPEFLEIAIALCNTLDILYQERIIHKDIKPSNILINPATKQIKLIDFSIASMLPREMKELQNANSLEGTLAYLSPEQTGRMNRGVDYRSDFYSLGITFYELLSGSLPFKSNDPMELVHCHLARLPIPVHQIADHVPLALSGIISKLMAKNAEDRYQSALGIKHDLEICLAQWQSANHVDVFELGTRDLSDRFIIPEKLYGRETEVNVLLQSFERVAQGSTEMILVAGFSGIGKTALVNEVHKPITRERGYFIKGKYDQFQRDIPFSAFVQAFRDLMKQLLSESDAQLNVWEMEILAALSDNAQILVDVIPELTQIIGNQPSAIALSGTAAQNRFNLLMQQFIRVFATAEHPLVIFLDDLQWADTASLKLLSLLMEDTKHLLIVGAYRDNEVSSTHPLMMTINEIVKSRAMVKTINLQPLSLVDMNQLVADILHCELSLATPLTDLVYQKTKGNPFFANQFLRTLYEDGQIKFARATGCWNANIAEIKALAITDDVVEFMAKRLQKLLLPTQNILKLAACIGAQFDLATLIVIAEKSLEEVSTALWMALGEGLILPVSDVYKFFAQSGDTLDQTQASVNVTYRFLHDRVQQAAYSLIPDAQKAQTHFKIGQLLQKNLSDIELEEKLFDVVGQLNCGKSLIEPREREFLARLNLKAAIKAKNSTAYMAAKMYLQSGIDLLDTGWQGQYDLTLKLYTAYAEASYLHGDLEGMERIAKIVLENAQTNLDKIKIYEIQIAALTATQRMLEAIAVGRDALHPLGILIPSEPSDELNKQILQNLAEQLQHRRIEELVNLPEMTDTSIQAAMRILRSLFAPIFVGAQNLLPFLSSTMVNLSLQYGNTAASAVGYTLYGFVSCALLGEVEVGYSFGKLSLVILDRFNAKEFNSMIFCLFATFIQHYKEPIRESIPILKQGYILGRETGDFNNMGYNIFNYGYSSFFSGVELGDLEVELTNYSSVITEAKQYSAKGYLDILRQTIQNLREDRGFSDCLDGDIYSETAMLPKHLQDNDSTVLFTLYFYKQLLAYQFGNYTSALEFKNNAELYLLAASGTLIAAIFHFYAALTCLALCHQAPDREDLLLSLQNYQDRLYRCSQNSPVNHLHQWYLVEAERQRVLGNKAEAIEHYDRAISLAEENQFLNEESLANELAAQFYLDWDKEKIAKEYLINAYYGYVRWGAIAKVQDLESRYPRLLAPILQQQISLSPTETVFAPSSLTASQTRGSQSSSTSISSTLDLESVLKASQILSSEIQLDRLLATLLHTVLENAGADKGALLMPREHQWYVEALATIDSPAQVETIELPRSQEVPHSLINNVKRSLQTVVIDNAVLHPSLAADAYILQKQPKSLLCTPILQQGKLIAILYLENQIATGAFTSDRLRVIEILCTQAAISLENARLYQQSQINLADLKQAEVQLQEAKDFLQLIIDNIPQLVFWKDLQLNYLGCNRLFAETIGFKSSQDVIGKTDYDMPWQKENSDLFRESEYRILESGVAELGIVESVIRDEGKQEWAEVNKIPLRDAHGKIIGILVTLQDITDRKQLEQERLRLISILEATSDIVGIADVKGNNVYLNQSGQEILGIPAAETNQFHISEVIAPAMLETFQTNILPVALREGIWSGEMCLRSRSGEEISVSQVLMTHKNAQGEIEFLSTIMRDIRDLKRIEAERQRKSEDLAQALQELESTQLQMIQSEKMSALGNLVAGVAHEMNNPLGFIAGSLKQAKPTLADIVEHLRIYQASLPRKNEEILEHENEIDLEYGLEDLPKMIDSMMMACDRLRNISTSLRTFSRADQDYKVPFNIHQGIDSTILILKHRLKASELHPEIEVVTNYGDLPQIKCFPGQLNQVFMNILANAIDALEESNQGRSFEEIKAQPNCITVTTLLEEQFVKIIIADNGKGMDEETKQKVFDRLFTTKAVGRGTGLGLAIARQIIEEKHQGNIKVSSIPSEGTIFSIAIPAI
ncbi:AAA family ATPase [Pseudanabaena sp. UWO310]|uniref:ATP-binding sensor histidine kinase n=1 Tax=Pseudanabaena sp. UWO310 TaxID=2480795 RepID=UPI0011591318|nr:AAA family ATPase [Pseudanabaena sp. UWO310]TYQ31106.1 AAA family ATPase [Pseudanabaena sp. UWO310]